jgi:hypothetical protein
MQLEEGSMQLYNVPGNTIVLAQPSSLVCWATVYTMMVSWKRQQSFGIRDAVAGVGTHYAELFDQNHALAPGEIPGFMRTAGLSMEPMRNLPLGEWGRLLRRHGLLWVGTLNSDSSGRHARIIEGFYEDDSSIDRSFFKIIDPAHGRRYNESFRRFVATYEGAFTFVNDIYFQIRHYV